MKLPKVYKWLLLTSLSLAGILGNAQALELKKGSHVVILGNTLAERMQHHGWLETYAQAAFTGQELVFRNHGFSGDRVDNRPRNRGFIDPHTYLEISKADVILTFFGSNAAWDNNPGNYKNALSKWIDETRTKKYNGKNAPTIVLFSPIAHEDLKSPNFPNGKDQNVRLEQITKVTADVAKEKKVEFVNLFSASQQLFANAKNPLTNNGIFLSNEGNKILSQLIFKSLFGKDAPVKSRHLDKINAAVLDKNWHWFNRYRATDGNDVWGGRSGLRFALVPDRPDRSELEKLGPEKTKQFINEIVKQLGEQVSSKVQKAQSLGLDNFRDEIQQVLYRSEPVFMHKMRKALEQVGIKIPEQSNKDVLWHELGMIDVMTSNRDKVVHAAASGKIIKADDSNVPPPIKVNTNIGGKGKGSNTGKEGTIQYMSAKNTVAQFELAKGLKANIFASEEMFPEIANPVQMAVDTKGRLWVAAWPTYPKWEPLKEMNDALVILPDENRDGVADKAITFAKVHNPTGFEFWNGGVIVASAPDLIYLKDTDGDDVADVRIRLLHGIDSADTHHAANNLIFGPGGNIYYQRGVFHVSNVETPWKGPQKHTNSAMYRFNPRTSEYAFHASNSPNPHGISFDYWGYHYATDGTGGRAYQVRPDGKGGFKMQSLLKKTVRPVPSSSVLSSAHFPDRNNGNFIICNSIGFLGLKQYTLSDDGNGNRKGTAIEDLLVSKKDRNFRPTDIEVGDDGALYVSDWQNVIVGHMQHNVRDPNRNKTHGRVYRVTAEGRDLMPHVKIDGEPIEKLLDHLKNKTNIIRHRARIELSERNTAEVIAATNKWLKQWDTGNKDHAHHILEALWLHQQHNVVNKKLLEQVLSSPVNHAQIAAKTVQQYWRDRL